MPKITLLSAVIGGALLFSAQQGVAEETNALFTGGSFGGAAVSTGPRAVAPPAGLIAFCQREPEQCRAPGQTRASLETAVANAQYSYWRAVFASGTTAQAGPAATRPRWRFATARPGASSGAGTLADVAFERVVIGSPEWRQVVDTNRKINREVRHMSDRRQFAVSDYWAVPRRWGAGGPRGDCEDYVLGKRAELMAIGVPASALSIALVTTPWNEPHAVLLVSTDAGDYVLDNLERRILHWSDADLTWRSRQRPGDLLQWIDLTGS